MLSSCCVVSTSPTRRISRASYDIRMTPKIVIFRLADSREPLLVSKQLYTRDASRACIPRRGEALFDARATHETPKHATRCPTEPSPSVSAWCTRPSWPSRRSATTVRPDPVVVSFYGIGSREQRAIVDGSRRAASAPRTRTRPRDAREVECLDTRATWRDRRASRANRGSSRHERPAASPGGAPRDGMDFVIFPATSA